MDLICLTCNFDDYDLIDNSAFILPTIIVVDSSCPKTSLINCENIQLINFPLNKISGSLNRSRYVKSILLYQLSIKLNRPILYHDFNIKIKKKINLQIGISVKLHPFNKTLKNEVISCGISGKLKIRDFIKAKKNLNENSVYECNLIGLNQPSDFVGNFMNLWYNRFCSDIKRDQIHFANLVEELNPIINDLPIENLRDENNYVKYLPHDSNLSFKRKVRRKFYKIFTKNW